MRMRTEARSGCRSRGGGGPGAEMVRIGLQLKATLENVTALGPGEEFRWYMKLRCANCGETTQKWIYVTTLELEDVKGGREILEDLVRPYSESERFQTIVVFEGRGLEPVEFDPRGGWTAVGVDSGTEFLDVDLSQKEWSDYDERAQQPVSILDISSRFIKM